MIRVISHSDLDGCGCVIILKRSFPLREVSYKLTNYDTIDQTILEGIEDLDDPQKDTQKLFITDICPGKETCKSINKRGVCNSTNKHVILVDHHVTRSWAKKYDWAFIDTKFCATELLYKKFCDGAHDYGFDSDLENFVHSVDAWDLWKFESPFLRQRGENLNSLAKFLGFDAFIEKFSKDINADLHEFHDLTFYMNRNRDEYIKKIIKEQLHVKPTHLDGNAKRFKILSASDFVSDLGHAALNDPDHEDLDYIVIVNPLYNSVSLRARKDETDVAEIAQKLGGGGHKSASGFTMRFVDTIENKVFNRLNRLEF